MQFSPSPSPSLPRSLKLSLGSGCIFEVWRGDSQDFWVFKGIGLQLYDSKQIPVTSVNLLDETHTHIHIHTYIYEKEKECVREREKVGMVFKHIEIDALFTRTDMNKKYVSFLQNSPLLIPESFPFV